jgi:ABC-type Fe3+-hydroxamate transport system substrate-binding protein
MPFITDQLSRKINVVEKPSRIISIVPSQTELLYFFGLDKEVIGITKFCVHPEKWFREKQRIGGTKTVNIPKIKELQPDLIIANKEENIKEQVEELAQDFPVWISDVNSLEEAYEMIERVGSMTGKQEKATTLLERIKTGFAQLVPRALKKRTAYLIWKDPYMTVGGDTFINDMLSAAGFYNIFQDRQRYPEITIEDLNQANCEILLLSSEPYPFKQKHIDHIQKQLPGAKILLVDGEAFSWYGSRLLHAADYFQELQKEIDVKL